MTTIVGYETYRPDRSPGDCASKKGYLYMAGGTYLRKRDMETFHNVTTDLIVNDMKWDYILANRNNDPIGNEYYSNFYPLKIQSNNTRLMAKEKGNGWIWRDRERDIGLIPPPQKKAKHKPKKSSRWGSINYVEPQWLKDKYAKKPGHKEPKQLEFDFMGQFNSELINYFATMKGNEFAKLKELWVDGVNVTRYRVSIDEHGHVVSVEHPTGFISSTEQKRSKKGRVNVKVRKDRRREFIFGRITIKF